MLPLRKATVTRRDEKSTVIEAGSGHLRGMRWARAGRLRSTVSAERPFKLCGPTQCRCFAMYEFSPAEVDVSICRNSDPIGPSGARRARRERGFVSPLGLFLHHSRRLLARTPLNHSTHTLPLSWCTLTNVSILLHLELQARPSLHSFDPIGFIEGALEKADTVH